MRDEENPDEPSGPSESGISRGRLDDLDLENVPLAEVRRCEAALGTGIPRQRCKLGATLTTYLDPGYSHGLAQKLFETPWLLEREDELVMTTEEQIEMPLGGEF
jgi:hypothetical protein